MPLRPFALVTEFAMRDLQASPGDLACTLSVPGAAFGSMPCLTAFSTSGCSKSGGTSASAAVESASTVNCRRSPKRICLDLEVVAHHVFRLALERDKRLVEAVEDGVQKRRKPADHSPRLRGFVVHQREDRVERVQQEMRSKLPFDRLDLAAWAAASSRARCSRLSCSRSNVCTTNPIPNAAPYVNAAASS